MATPPAGSGPALDRTGDDLLAALEAPSCPVCTVTRRSVRAYLDTISYEAVTDVGVREGLVASLGYCAVHGQEWLAVQNTLGTALIYRDVCAQIARLLADPGAGGGVRGRLQALAGALARGTAAGRALAAALQPRAACPACRHSREREAQAVIACAAAFTHPPFFAAFAAHPVGLCLPHLRAVLPRLADAALLVRVVAAHAARVEAIHADLSEVVRKYDYRFTHEPHGSEFAAPAHSVVLASGDLPTLLNLPPDGD